jgi:hypothetical protein
MPAKRHAGGIRRHWWLTPRRFRAVRDLLTATDRMRDRWAEGDGPVKQELWITLHTRADQLREAMD